MWEPGTSPMLVPSPTDRSQIGCQWRIHCHTPNQKGAEIPQCFHGAPSYFKRNRQVIQSPNLLAQLLLFCVVTSYSLSGKVLYFGFVFNFLFPFEYCLHSWEGHIPIRASDEGGVRQGMKKGGWDKCWKYGVLHEFCFRAKHQLQILWLLQMTAVN